MFLLGCQWCKCSREILSIGWSKTFNTFSRRVKLEATSYGGRRDPLSQNFIVGFVKTYYFSLVTLQKVWSHGRPWPATSLGPPTLCRWNGKHMQRRPHPLPAGRSIYQWIKRRLIIRHGITQAITIQNKKEKRKWEVSKYLCTACVSENYNQTTESYAQAAARDAVVVGGCIAATRPMMMMHGIRVN